MDDPSESDLLIYGTEKSADYVAYMTPDLKVKRTAWAKELNMGGTTDWAVDLMEFEDYDGDDDDDDNESSCRPEHRTWHDSAVKPPAKDLKGWLDRVTVVNLTPHHFKLAATEKGDNHDLWHTGDVDPGQGVVLAAKIS